MMLARSSPKRSVPPQDSYSYPRFDGAVRAGSIRTQPAKSVFARRPTQPLVACALLEKLMLIRIPAGRACLGTQCRQFV